MSNTLLITGAAGFLGRHAARHFRGNGWSVVGVDNALPGNAPLADLAAYYNIRLPSKELSGLLEKHAPGLCIHCAGNSSVGSSVTDPQGDFYSNTALTFEVLNALRLHAPACRFILLSSAAVYGNPRSLPVAEAHPCAPISPYGFHKWQCEQLCLEFSSIYGLATASVRIFSAYGEGLRRQVLWDMCKKVILQNELTLQGTGNESRDFIHAADIVRAIHRVNEKAPMRGEVYNVASGREVSIRHLSRLVLDALGSAIIPQFDGKMPPGVPLNWRADITRLESLGYEASLQLEQGIASFAEWCRGELKKG